LRERLELARGAGDAFEVAWGAALEPTIVELRGSSRFEIESWRAAFGETRNAWAAAYDHAGAGWHLSLELLDGRV